MGYIYLRTNKVNGKKYVGQVITRRFKKRQKDWDNLNQPYAGEAINSARAKYGLDAFDFEILKECEDDELNYWETYYIKELNTKAPYGYNLTDGGDGVNGYSPSEETKRKMSEALKGENHPLYGKHHTEETKRKLSDAMKGKHLTDETKRKMSESRTNGKKSKSVLQLNKNTGEVIRQWPSVSEVERQLGYSNANISNCCLGKRNTASGFKWKYAV